MRRHFRILLDGGRDHEQLACSAEPAADGTLVLRDAEGLVLAFFAPGCWLGVIRGVEYLPADPEGFSHG